MHNYYKYLLHVQISNHFIKVFKSYLNNIIFVLHISENGNFINVINYNFNLAFVWILINYNTLRNLC